MASAHAQKHLQREVRALRALMARLWHRSTLSGDALWQTRHIQNLSSASRSVASAAMTGALSSTAVSDIGTSVMAMSF